MSPYVLPRAMVEQALAEEWCNGCSLPRSKWGPVCSGMTQGDATHYHSPEWWRPLVPYRLFLNDEQTMLVRLWEDGGQGHIEVATRDHQSDTWERPTYLSEQVSK